MYKHKRTLRSGAAVPFACFTLRRKHTPRWLARTERREPGMAQVAWMEIVYEYLYAVHRILKSAGYISLAWQLLSGCTGDDETSENTFERVNTPG